MAFLIPDMSILKDSISISTKTGVNPKSKMTSIVDAYVKSGVITSSPGLRSVSYTHLTLPTSDLE